MAKIIAPNEQYTGVSAGITFINGVGETADPYLIEWFKEHGYTVEGEAAEDPEDDELKGLSIDELKAYAIEHDLDIGNATSLNGILKKIRESQKAGE